MSKKSSSFSCIECGSFYPKWVGRCTACGGWNTIIEEQVAQNSKVNINEEVKLEELSSSLVPEERIPSFSHELDRVLGGGIVSGSAILISGEPGVGKSTLLLDLAAKLAKNNIKVIYSSGEESLNQIRIRAERMKITDSKILLANEANLAGILGIIQNLKKGDILIVDSIQTIFCESIQSPQGSIAQVRYCTSELLKYTKQKGASLFLVGHINKEGQIAGPKVLEHMVDVVLYFEEDSTHQFRILRNIKNRFGNVQETGIYKMVETGLIEIENPSALFLSKGEENKVGSIVFAGTEGTRPIMFEVEALLAPSFTSFPKRVVVGGDANRLAMIIAVLTNKLKIKLHEKEVYLNITGGIKPEDSSLDLAVAVAIFSCFFEVPVKKEIAVFGEISLSGDVRPTGFMDGRIKEAVKLGYTTILCPKLLQDQKPLLQKHNIIEVANLNHLKHIIV